MRTGPETPLLVMRGIAKRFGAIPALEDVSFDLRGGEVHALVGENGAGKSTLMKVLSGATQPDRGEMLLGGEPYYPGGPRDALRRGVAMIYQEVMIAPHLSVEANVMLGQERARRGFVDRKRQRREVREALGLLDHADISLGTTAGRLNLAARQIVEIARALVSNARVLVFDEPTSSLNDRDSERLFRVIERLRQQGLGIVYISHFLNEVSRVAQRYTVLRDGRSVGSGSLEGVTSRQLASLMVGRDISELFPKVPHEIGEEVLAISDLQGKRLPKDASLTLHRGEILGLAGLVGAGRTELLRAIYGLDPIRSGTIRVAHLAGGSMSNPTERIQQGFGLLSEDRKAEGLALDQSIEDNMTYSALSRHSRVGVLNLGGRRKAVTTWIDRLRIKTTGASAPVRRLSGGNQQKVALARLLHQEAQVLLLDEPTRGIDIASKVEIYRLIGELASQGKSILLVSSYLPEILGICDRIAVMSRGVLTPARPAAAWSETTIMEAATGGTSDLSAEEMSG